MIKHLHIQNVALIDEVEVSFAPGFNVLTGETGAGKSIVVDSINFLLGGRVSRDLIRAGADYAFVEGLIEADHGYVKSGLAELGINTDDGQIMLSRQMQADTGKTTCRINGRVVTAGLLKEAAEFLVDLHGQHEHQSLLDPAKQLVLLDQFCGEGLSDLKQTLEGLLSRYKEISRELKKLNAAAGPEQVEIWRFQLDEIEKAALKPGEEDALLSKRNRLGGLEKLSQNTEAVIGLLYSGFFEGRPGLSAVDQTAKAAALSGEIAKLDPEREHLHAEISDIHTRLAEITRDFRTYAEELDADPAELDKTEARLDIIYRLKKKYGGSFEAVLKKRDELTQSLDMLDNSELRMSELDTTRKAVSKKVTNLCAEITALRTNRAAQISGTISEILSDLGMKNAKFSIEISRKQTFGPDGNDQTEFMISPNPGEPAKPLRKIASGGEMSRIMLAIKTVMTDRVPTVIFDEVDSGVSGRAAQQVAEKLAKVSRTRQILCITHLPQIAAMADTHFLIEKSAKSDRTVTSVQPLSNDASINELARLTSGAQTTAATLEAAKEMKAQAEGLKEYAFERT